MRWHGQYPIERSVARRGCRARWPLVVAALLLMSSASAADLDALADDIAGRFDSIEHVSPATLADWREGGRELILLDVRSAEEYAVGRIPGAIRIPPGAAAAEVMARIDGPITGATVVAYCSVGQRSSLLATKVHQELRRAGAERIANLRGGVFAWHDQERPLVDSAGPTRWVHPYSSDWGRYLERDEATAYAPRE